MSTKIYDAFKFDKQYSVLEIGQLADKWRKDLANIAEKEYAALYIKQLVYYYDLYKIRGAELIEQLVKKTKEDSKETYVTRMMEDMIANGYKYLMIHIDRYLREIIKTDEFLSCKFRCKMTIHPIPRKTLCMIFAGNEFYNYLANQPELKDYHYQNQTDKPDEISKKAWDRRRDDWDKAIGPDYIPINHGLSITLLDPESSNGMCFITNSILHDMKNHAELMPDIDRRAKKIAETFENPDKDLSSMSVSEIIDYTRSDEYKSWMNSKIQEILPQLDTDITTIISNITE